jgi:antitoxin component YwqK of YwqJK toxin-antitoxin module
MPFKYLLVILVSLFTISAFAQKQNVYFLKDSGKEVSTRDSADFTRIISEPDSGTNLFNIKEYYSNGKIKLVGKTSASYASILNGSCVSFYTTGKRQQMASYSNGLIVGNTYDYYPNGTLYRIKQYPITPDDMVTRSTEGEQIKFDIISFRDSSGKVSVTDGNGYYIDYYPDFKRIHEEGYVKNGKRDGEWKGTGNEKDSLLIFNERYDSGTLLEGASKDINGKTYTYKQRDILPEFKGGEEAFGKFLASNFKPHENVHGKVFTQFIIEKNGMLTNFKTISSYSDNLNVETVQILGAEALRVLKRSPNWKPGLKYGRPTRVQYTVPINFSLSY